MIYSYAQDDVKLFVANTLQSHRKQPIGNTSIYENANPTVFCHKLLRQHHWNIKTTCWDDVSICKIGWIANSTNALIENNRLFHSQFFYSQWSFPAADSNSFFVSPRLIFQAEGQGHMDTMNKTAQVQVIIYSCFTKPSIIVEFEKNIHIYKH